MFVLSKYCPHYAIRTLQNNNKILLWCLKMIRIEIFGWPNYSNKVYILKSTHQSFDILPFMSSVLIENILKTVLLTYGGVNYLVSSSIFPAMHFELCCSLQCSKFFTQILKLKWARLIRWDVQI